MSEFTNTTMNLAGSVECLLENLEDAYPHFMAYSCATRVRKALDELYSLVEDDPIKQLSARVKNYKDSRPTVTIFRNWSSKIHIHEKDLSIVLAEPVGVWVRVAKPERLLVKAACGQNMYMKPDSKFVVHAEDWLGMIKNIKYRNFCVNCHGLMAHKLGIS